MKSDIFGCLLLVSLLSYSHCYSERILISDNTEVLTPISISNSNSSDSQPISLSHSNFTSSFPPSTNQQFFQAREVCFVGATPNFFKVGHSAVREISRHFPQVHMRLGLISEMPNCPPIVQDLLQIGRLSYHTWPLNDTTEVIWNGRTMTAELKGLTQFFTGCDSALLVPPIDGRVAIGKKYARAVSLAGVKRAVVLGVQWSRTSFNKYYPKSKIPLIVEHAEQLYSAMETIFSEENSKIKYAIVNSPMFLENILYQTERLRGFQMKGLAGTQKKQFAPFFSFPMLSSTEFAYITCKDLGRLTASALVQFDRIFKPGLKSAQISSIADRRFELEFATGLSSPSQLELFLQKINPQIRYIEQSRESFIDELKTYLSKSEEGAETIAQLYDELKAGHQAHLEPSHVLQEIFGFPEAQTAQEWIEEHKEVFEREKDCQRFPLPPAAHQAPPPWQLVMQNAEWFLKRREQSIINFLFRQKCQ